MDVKPMIMMMMMMMMMMMISLGLKLADSFAQDVFFLRSSYPKFYVTPSLLIWGSKSVSHELGF